LTALTWCFGKHGNEPLVYTKRENYLSAEKPVLFQERLSNMG